MSLPVRANLLSTCRYLERALRSREPNGKLLAHGIRRGIVAILRVPTASGALPYLTRVTTAVVAEMSRVKSHKGQVAAILRGLEIVLRQIETEGATRRPWLRPGPREFSAEDARAPEHRAQ